MLDDPLPIHLFTVAMVSCEEQVLFGEVVKQLGISPRATKWLLLRS